MNEHADQPGTPDNPSGNPGKTLQTQREAMGWTVEQVADQLKLAPRQVVALEAGDFASLPSPAVTRGFVRAYAKLLKIDAAPLVSMIEMNMPPQAQAGAPMARREQRPAAFNETRFPLGGKRNRLPVGWIVGVLVVAGAVAAAWQLGVFPGNRPAADANPADGVVLESPVGATAPATNGAAAPGTAQAPLNNPSVPLISVPAPAADGATSAPTGAAPGATAPATAPVNAPVTTAPAGTAPAVAPGAAPAAQATVPAAVPAAAAAAPTAAAGANALVLNVREDSWIEVRPAKGGRPLISRLVKAGSTETFELTEPVNLVVGAPTGVTATLRGANIALPQAPGKTISRVSLK